MSDTQTLPPPIEIPERSTDPVDAAIGLRESVEEVRKRAEINPFDFGDSLARGILHGLRQVSAHLQGHKDQF